MKDIYGKEIPQEKLDRANAELNKYLKLSGSVAGLGCLIMLGGFALIAISAVVIAVLVVFSGAL